MCFCYSNSIAWFLFVYLQDSSDATGKSSSALDSNAAVVKLLDDMITNSTSSTSPTLAMRALVELVAAPENAFALLSLGGLYRISAVISAYPNALDVQQSALVLLKALIITQHCVEKTADVGFGSASQLSFCTLSSSMTTSTVEDVCCIFDILSRVAGVSFTLGETIAAYPGLLRIVAHYVDTFGGVIEVQRSATGLVAVISTVDPAQLQTSAWLHRIHGIMSSYRDLLDIQANSCTILASLRNVERSLAAVVLLDVIHAVQLHQADIQYQGYACLRTLFEDSELQVMFTKAEGGIEVHTMTVRDLLCDVACSFAYKLMRLWYVTETLERPCQYERRCNTQTCCRHC
jgi:hypothetical protein